MKLGKILRNSGLARTASFLGSRSLAHGTDGVRAAGQLRRLETNTQKLSTFRLALSRWYYLVGAAGIAAHLTLALPQYTMLHRTLACVPLIVLLLLLDKCLKQTYKSVPIVLLAALQLYVFYSVPQFTQEGITLWGGIYYEPSEEALTNAMMLVVFGELLFILGYWISSRLSMSFVPLIYRASPTPTLRWSSTIFLYSVVGFLIHAFTALRPDYLPISIRYTAGTLVNVYLGLSVILYLGFTHKSRKLMILGYLMASAMAMVGLIQGVLGAMLGPFLILFLSKWIWGRGFRIRTLVFVGFAAILINPVKDEFRHMAWVDKDVSSFEKVGDRLENWGQAFENVWVTQTSDRTPLTSTASRANDLLPFAQAIDYVPAYVPYNLGDGMIDSLLFWIPRVVWPEKKSSSDLIYNQYAVAFGFTDAEGTKTTTVGASVFIEGFWNFDRVGVLSFLFIYGLILGLLFGTNGKFENVSVITCLVYVGPSVFVLQALSVAVAALFSFVIGVFISLRVLEVLSDIASKSFVKGGRQFQITAR